MTALAVVTVLAFLQNTSLRSSFQNTGSRGNRNGFDCFDSFVSATPQQSEICVKSSVFCQRFRREILVTLTLQSLLFSISLLFFRFPISLAFLCLFHFFSKDFRVPRKTLAIFFFGVSLAFFFLQKKARVGGLGEW